MSALSLFLKLVAPLFVVVAMLHLVLGLGADTMLGAEVSSTSAAEPTLDSQNRFYGVSFAFYGIALYIGAGDLRRYQPVLRALFYVLMVAGLARLASWAAYGMPAPLVVALGAVEVLAPPVLLFWLDRATRE
jgi:hypothetical protein